MNGGPTLMANHPMTVRTKAQCQANQFILWAPRPQIVLTHPVDIQCRVDDILELLVVLNAKEVIGIDPLRSMNVRKASSHILLILRQNILISAEAQTSLHPLVVQTSIRPKRSKPFPILPSPQPAPFSTAPSNMLAA